MNTYRIVSEILAGKHEPNVDMLIIKPMLYTYVSNRDVESVKKNGVRCGDDGYIHCYFSRVPESLDSYRDFLSNNTCVRVQVNKLEKIKDQKVRIVPFNLSGYDKDLLKDDVEKLAAKNNFFYNYFKRGMNIAEIPHAMILLENKILPSFAYKVLE